MAAKPPKPPDNSSVRMVKLEKEQNSTEDLFQCQPAEDEKSDCSCTNISIRQLFYEMKQIFPTVPDNVVNQCVIDNCHDRENCIKILTNEVAAHPTSAQSYPSQSIRGCGNIGSNTGGSVGSGNQMISAAPSRKPLVPVRPAPTPKPTNSGSGDVQLNSKKLKASFNQLRQDIKNELDAIRGNCSNNSDMRPSAVNSETLTKPTVPQRPTTLNLRDPATRAVPNTRTLNRPTRTAPLPPSASAVPGAKSAPLPPQSVLPPSQHHSLNDPTTNQSFSSGASVQSPMSFSDSGESEISVNISLSPSSSDRSRVGVGASGVTPTRCITTISVQPEPAYTRAISGAEPGMPTPITTTPHRSYTSLNVTLRKPSDSPQSPIDITAGSVLKYSSTRYDAINGCEQNFHITVTDGGGSVTSSRIRPRSCHYDPEIAANTSGQYTLRTGISMPNVASPNTPVGGQTTSFMGPPAGGSAAAAAQDEIIRRQQARKSKLSNEVKNKRQQLEEMNKEINILQSPMSPNVCDQLDREIEILRYDCERLCQEINSRNGNAGVSFERVIENMYSGQPSGIPARQRPPPIPPALSRFRSRQSPYYSTPSAEPSNVIQNPYQRSQSYPLQAGAIPPNHGGYDQADYTNANYIDDNGPPWICSMCTFQNYPLLNKCEGCDNVRIIPGTVQIVPSSSALPVGSLLPRLPNPNNNNNTSPALAASGAAANTIVTPPMQPVVSTHHTPLTSNNFVNNNSATSNHNHLHNLGYLPANVHSNNSPIVQNNNNSGRSPNMHQLVAYPAVMNPNFMIPQ